MVVRLVVLVVVALCVVAGCSGDDADGGEPVSANAAAQRYVRIGDAGRIADDRTVSEVEEAFSDTFDADNPFDCSKPSSYWALQSRDTPGDAVRRAMAVEVAFCPELDDHLVEAVVDGLLPPPPPQLIEDLVAAMRSAAAGE